VPDPRITRLTTSILDEASKAFEGWTCPSSAECCHFERTGREPYATAAEWALIEEELLRQGRRLSSLRDDGACPFLTADERCLVYRARPLGCRTFFCALASPAQRVDRRLVTSLVRELEDLSGAMAGEARGRPLRAWVRRPRRKDRRSRGSAS
jgi:Fe-S-cluster containining protein